MDQLYELFLNELKFFKEHSNFTSHEIDSISATGDLVEVAIRKFLREIIGERFKVTHGYIYSSKFKEYSPQIDIIITDKLVPHSFKKFEYLDGMEVVPAEAVVGIFEVKRTLTTESYKKAIEHLIKIVDKVPLQKNHKGKYLPGGLKIESGIEGGKFSNPIIGIISLLSKAPKSNLDKVNIPWFIDIVFSCDGYLKAPKNEANDSFRVFSYKTQQDSHKYQILDCERSKASETRILQAFVIYLIEYLNEVSGRTLNMNDYLT